jgi:hypothetical protein
MHLRQWRNFVSAPLLRLPTELILDIFVLTLKISYRGFRFWVTLTAICHRIRDVLVYSPSPWRIINADSTPLAKLFLERCNFDPHALFVMDRLSTPSPRGRDKTRFWEGLEGRTFDSLRFFMFRGLKEEFEHRVFDLFRRTPNLSTLEIETRTTMNWDLEWTLRDQPLPHLTMLRLSQVSINWDAPILRNLTRLNLNFIRIPSPKQFTSVKMFLSVLENCPDLEMLHLASAGPDPESGAQDNSKVVQLHKLQELSLTFNEGHIIACILSHVWFPASTKVQVEATCDHGPYATLSRILPSSDAAIFQHLQKTTIVSIEFFLYSFELAIDLLLLDLRPGYYDLEDEHQPDLESVPQFISKVVEIIGGDAVTALHLRFDLPYDIPRGVWKELLHDFPHLQVISYNAVVEWSAGCVDPFCSVFAEPFEGGLVCPELRNLKVPQSFAQGSSAVTLKRTLLERGACDRRLKRISVSEDVEDEMAILRPFRDVVDEISQLPTPISRLSPHVSGFFERNEAIEN